MTGMSIYSRRQKWKFSFFLFAVLIGIGSIIYTNQLVKKLATEERKKVELWAEGTRRLATTETDSEEDISFIFKVIENNSTVPVILVGNEGEIITHRNLDTERPNEEVYLQKKLNQMKEKNKPIEVHLLNENKNYVYYNDSTLLTQLQYYPFIQISIILLFILVSYFAFNASMKAEQNQVWVGMSKETAHQLGTPISSLIGWLEILKEKQLDQQLIHQMGADIHRLEKITERFSKIGSGPILEKKNITKVIINSVNYVKARFSNKIQFVFNFSEEDEILVPLNMALFEWVIENLCKNAIDAMQGQGKIIISLHDNIQVIYIDISDTGKGIPKNKFKTIFRPGYTTKDRGWGLGLSLTKRIIEEYHSGKVFVNNSEPNLGTTFRLVLKK